MNTQTSHVHLSQIYSSAKIKVHFILKPKFWGKICNIKGYMKY